MEKVLNSSQSYRGNGTVARVNDVCQTGKRTWWQWALAILAWIVPGMSAAWAEEAIGKIYYNQEGGFYEIKSTYDMNDLAVYVNGYGYYRDNSQNETRHNCQGLKFKLMNDIKYSSNVPWLDVENLDKDRGNYNVIGEISSESNFCGEFDGNGHKLSGINALADDYNDRNYQGVFGVIGSGAYIHDLTLDDTRVVGYEHIGGIVGKNNNGVIRNCHVTNKVMILIPDYGVGKYIGGIAGENIGTIDGNNIEYGLIDGCTSQVMIHFVSESEHDYYGGITGCNGDYGKLTNNLAINVYFENSNTDNRGAIAGSNSENGVMQNNYHRNCEYGLNGRNEMLGCANAKITTDNGAVKGYIITLAEGMISSAKVYTILEGVNDKPVTYNIAAEGDEVTLGYSVPAALGYTYKYKVGDDELPLNKFKMPASDVSATVDTSNPKLIDWEIAYKGKNVDPYIIYNKEQLNLLANRVKGLNGETRKEGGYAGEYFKLGADISYEYTSDWNENENEENNFEAIGGYIDKETNYDFCGDFYGDNHTISGIRIYTPNNNVPGKNQGLFGSIGNGGNVNHLKLADTRITGQENVGGIAGNIKNGGKVEFCEVGNNVGIYGKDNSATKCGGIAGYNEGRISRSISSATISNDNVNNDTQYGGIVGANETNGSINECVAVGAKVEVENTFMACAIAGFNQGSIIDNFYTACKIGVLENATNVGINNGERIDIAGAMPLLHEYVSAEWMILLLEGRKNVPLSFSRDFSAGVSSTICLPFEMNVEQQGVEGTFYRFAGIDTQNWIVTMEQMDPSNAETSKLAEHIPYLFKPKNDGTVNFFGTISEVESEINGGSVEIDNWKFGGTYSGFSWNENMGPIYGFASTAYTPDDNSYEVKAGDFVMAMEGASVRAYRAYMYYDSSNAVKGRRAKTELPSSIKVVLIGKDGSTTAINDMRIGDNGDWRMDDAEDGWFTIDGRRLAEKPSARGIYINNGRKVAIK